MHWLKAWIKASRLPAQLFIFPSLLLGQGAAYAATGAFSTGRFVALLLFGFFMHFFIVYGNDYSDYETDRLNTTYTPFTGGSRVLVDGEISRHHLLWATWLMAATCIVMGFVFVWLTSLWLTLILVLLGLALLHAYSFHPIRLSYRGFGELLQMLGVGLVLPWLGFLVQSNHTTAMPWVVLAWLLPSQLGMAISTALPDEPSDRTSLKRTTAVLLGGMRAKWLMFFLYFVSFSGLLLTHAFDVTMGSTVWFIGILSTLLVAQFILVTQKRTTPGQPALVLLVFVSILLNTLMVIAVTTQFFLVV
ncbi:MAG: prenyltransferase [Acholeplasmatales bacterium]|nr:MAG: prenyltransferase [Acholeplasmatales bacterium]